MTTLREFLPQEAQDSSPELLEKYGDALVVKTFDGTEVSFPDRHRKYRHVMRWALLDDGSAVGWNESPRVGWSFPRIGKKALATYHQQARNPGFELIKMDA